MSHEIQLIEQFTRVPESLNATPDQEGHCAPSLCIAKKKQPHSVNFGEREKTSMKLKHSYYNPKPFSQKVGHITNPKLLTARLLNKIK